MGRESRSLGDPGFKTGKADVVEDKKGGNEFTICVFKGQDKNVVRFPLHCATLKVISLQSSEMSSKKTEKHVFINFQGKMALSLS